jgi:glycolate oxidase FAD binding subunit
MPPEPAGLRERLEAIVGAEVSAEPAALAPFAVDGVVPAMVVRPGTQEAVAAVVGACAAHDAAIIPWGGGTAMGLGNPPRRADVALRLDRLTRIVEFDAANLNVTVEAGMRLADLAAVLREGSEVLPLDPPAEERATVGGLLAANLSGPSRLLYGTARDWVLGLRVVLPDGERIRCGGKVIKNVSGYDMNKLFIGSLGTLGIITEATFKLLPLPVVRASVVGLFAGLDQAAQVVARVLDSVLLPEAMEFLDPGAVSLLGRTLGLTGTGFGLAVALAGSPETVERQARDFGALLRESRARVTTLAAEENGPAWRAIRNAFEMLPGSPEGRVIVKIAVPISQTAALFGAAERLAERQGLTAALTAHAGSGGVRACYAQGPAAVPTALLADALEALRREAVAAEGSLVLEAAPPRLKARLDAWGTPGEGFPVMRRLKAEFDPHGLLNPGRFLGGL